MTRNCMDNLKDKNKKFINKILYLNFKNKFIENISFQSFCKTIVLTSNLWTNFKILLKNRNPFSSRFISLISYKYINNYRSKTFPNDTVIFSIIAVSLSIL